MIEGDQEKSIVHPDPMAGLFLNRLMDLTNLRAKIDNGSLPIAYFGEIPIEVTNYPRRGLRWGVLKGISDAYQTLTDSGYENEAKAIVSFQERRDG